MLSYINERNVERMIDAKNAEITRKINGDYTLSFIAIDEPDLLEELIVICEGQKYRIKQLSSTMSGNKTLQSVTCKHISFDLIDYYAYDYLTNTVTLDKALQFLFKDTPFTYSISDSIKNQSFEKLGECNKQKLLAKIIEAYGLEYEVDNYHFTFKKKVGYETEFQFRYKANISNVKKDIDTTSLTTYIKGYGKKDDEGNYLCTAEYTSPNAEKFGVRHADPVFDERFTIQSELLEYIKTKLNDTPDIVVELDYTQIDSSQPINLGDYGYLIHEPLQLDLLSRVIEITKKLSTDRQGNNYQNMTYKIGSQKLVKSSFETSKDSITGSIDTGSLDITIPDVDYDRIQAEIEAGKQEATDKINTGLGGYVTKTRNELLIMDTEDKATARNLWRWNINGLGFSSNGYSGPFATAITNDGKINADRILVGTIDGALIRANTIKANSLEISTVQKINSAITADDATAIMNTRLEVYDGNIKTHISTVSESKKTEAINSANQNTTSAINSAKTELNQNINTAKSDLTSKINLKANASDVYGKSEVYTKTQTDSAIKQSKDNISLEVSNKYETKVDAEAKITNLKITGVNRVLNTDGESEVLNLNNSSNQTWGPYKISGDVSEQKVIIAFDYKATNIVKGSNYAIKFQSTFKDPSDVSQWYPTFDFNLAEGTSEGTVVSSPITFGKIKKGTQASFRFRFDNVAGTFQISKARVFIGSKDLGWSPAPEDVNSLIDTAAINAINSANQNTATVIANYYTKSETDSKISVAKDEINLGVSNKYETKANVETKVTSTLNSAKSYADTKKTEAINSAATDATSKVNAAKSELNTAIGKKANTVDVYSKAEVYTKGQTDSAIKVAKDEINLGVSNTYETKANVETKITSIQVGATNKLVGTATSKNTNVNVPSSYVVWDPYTTHNKQTLEQLGFKVGDKVTVGFDWAISKNGSNNYVYGNFRVEFKGIKADGTDNQFVGVIKNPAATFSSSNTKGRVEATVTLDSNNIKAHSIRFRVDNSVLNFKVSNVKLEKGTKATSWSPAPEDISTDITTAKNDAISSASTDAANKANNAKNEAINSANATLTSTIANYYTKSQTDSQIKVAKDEINLGVSNTYETKANVETKVNSIEIGGRNLAKQTKLLTNVSLNGWTVTNTGNEGFKKLEIVTTNTSWQECNIPLYTEINTITRKVTISFEYQETSSGLLMFNFGSYNGNTRVYECSNVTVSSSFKVISTNGSWKTVCYTFDPTSVNNKDGITQYKIQFKKASGKTGTIYIRKPKIEFGTKATSWSPAPEDISADINTAKNDAITSANNTLNSTIANYYTKAQTDSQINVAKDAITQSVSSTYETKTNVETKVNTTLNSAKSYADTKKSEAISSAATDAANKVNSAKNELNTAINKKANSADVYKKTEVYTKNETNSQITTAKNEINQSVSNTYETKTNVTTKLNNLSVSATNLMDNSAPLSTSGWGGWSSVSGLSTNMEVSTTDNSTHGKQGKITFSGSATGHAGRHKGPVQKLTSGKKYSWSIWLRSGSGNLTVDVGQEQNGRKEVSVGTTWTRFTHTFTANDSQYYAFVIRPKNVNSSHSLYFHSVMLVEGDKPVAWQTSPTEVLSDKTNIEQRMTSAESKITDTAITNTVKKNFYTKEETNNQITSKGYQTSSQVQQTVDNLQIKFTQSGGYNMIRNSLSRQGSKYWYTGKHNGSGDIKFNTTSINNTRTRLEFTVTGLNSALGGVMSAPIPVVAGKKYTMSCDVEVHRGQNIGFEVMFWSRENWGYSTNPDVGKHLPGTFKSGKVTNTFTAPTNAQFMQVYFWGKYTSENTQWNYAHYFIGNLIVCEGELATAWSPHPNEVYEGLTTIDRDGIKVSTSRGAYTHFNSDGMNSYDNDGNMTLGLRNGGMTFHAWNNHEYVGYISQAASRSTDHNGVCLGMTPLGDYISFGVSSNATDPNSGFSQTSYFVIAPHDNYDNNTAGLNAYKHLNMHGWDITNGGTVTAGVFYSKNGMKFKGSSPIYFDGDATYPSAIWEDTGDGMIRFYGDNGIIMGYRNGNTNEQCFYIKETKDGLNCRIGMYDHLNMNGWRIKNATVNNCSFRLDEYKRTTSDYVSIFKASTSSKSEMNIELANDYVTWFNIQANNYADGGRYIACFNYQNGTAASNVGVHFYRAMNCHGYNITNVGNMSVYSVRSEELEVNDIRVSTPFAVMSRSGEQTSLSVTKSIDDLTEANGTVTISNKQAKVELPQGLIFTDYYVQVTGNKIANLAITERTDEYFIIETDSEEEIEVFYTIKAFQPKYVTRTAVYGELHGEEGIATITYEEAMAEERARTAQLLSAEEGSKPEDLSKPGEPVEIVRDSFHT